MARAILLLVLVALAAGAAAFLWPSDPGTDPGDAWVEKPDAPPPTGPLLRGAGEDASALPLSTRGHGGIVGHVMRGGTPVKAAVSLRLVERLAATDPLGAWRGTSFIDRILDGGMARSEPIAQTRSAADGTFSFERLGAGLYELRAHAADDSSALVSVALPGAGARVDALLEIASGDLALEGRVEYADGTPFRGYILVEPAANSPFSGFTPGPGTVVAPTDADGHFTAAGLTAGPRMLGVVDPGRLRLFGAMITLPHAAEFRLVLGDGARRLRGRVVSASDAAPIEGAWVTGGGGAPGTGILLTRVRTAADGLFELLLPKGDSGLFVEAPGYAPLTTEWSGNDEETVVRLQRTARVTGRVVHAESRESVGGTWVFAVPLDRRGFSLAFPAAALTDPSGRFELPEVTPTSIAIFALGQGVATPALSEVRDDGYIPLETVLAPGESREVVLEVGPSASATGRVLRTDGVPAAGASVTFETNHALVQNLRQAAFFGGGHGAVVTDGEGRFATDALVPGAGYTVRVDAAGHPSWSSDGFEVAAGETHELEVRLPAVQWFEVLVTATDGTPLAAEVTAATRTTEDDAGLPAEGTWRTGTDGRTRVGPLPPGEIGLRATAADHVAQEEWVTAASTSVTTLVLDPGLSLAGTVKVPGGALPAAAQISIDPEVPTGIHRTRHATADGSGRWRVGGLREVPYEISVVLHHEGEAWTATSIADAGRDDVALVLVAPDPEETRTLTVVLTMPDGSAAGPVEVTLHVASGNSSSSHSRTVAGGRIVFDLDPDEVAGTIHVEVSGDRRGRFGAVLAGPFDASQGEVEVVLPPPLSIAGVVVDSGGGPVKGAVVEARHRALEHHWGTHGRAFSDETGRFEIRGLGDVDYQLGVKAPGRYAEPDAVSAHGGATDVRIVLQAAVSAVVTVLDPAGRPVEGAWVVVRRPPEDPDWEASTGPMLAHVYTGSDGGARLGGLPPGTWHLAVQVDEDSGFRSASVEAWPVEDRTIRLEHALMVEGVVRAPDGTPVRDAFVIYTADGGESTGMAHTDDAGRFRVTGLHAGTIRLKAAVGNAWSPQWNDEGSVEAAAGAKGVVLVVDPGATLRIIARGWQRPGAGAPAPWGVPVQIVTEGEEGDVRFEHLDEAWSVEVGGLDPNGTYAIRIAHPDGRYAHAAGVRPGGSVELTPRPGRTVEGRIVLPDGVEASEVNFMCVAEGFFVHVQPDTDGTFRAEGLPDGQHEFAASVYRQGADGEPDRQWVGGTRASPGDDAEIVLEAVR